MKKVLFVDSSLSLIEAYASFLNYDGWKCSFATNGKEALEKILEDKPDLVLTDVEMPIMGGYELCKRIRANPGTKDLYIIASSLEALPEGMRNYIDGSIPKGETLEIVNKIKEILGGK